MKKLVTLCVLGVISVSWITPRAQAIAPFKKAFQKKYVTDSGNETLKAAFKKSSCNTCHVKGKKKDVRNAYGNELAKLIEGDANQRIKDAGKSGGKEAKKAETDKVLKELGKALDKVADQEDADGEKYGDRIKAGKLPVEPQASSSEPTKG